MPKKYILLTPGPTPIPDSVARRAAEPILHHRTQEFGKIFLEVLEELKYVFQTREDILLLTCSGTGAMESAVVNLCSPGEKVLVASCGAFGNRWAKIAKAFGLEVILLEEEWGRACDPERLRGALKTHSGVSCVFLTHTETSTGTWNDLAVLARIVHAESGALMAVDAISGLAAQELRGDAWGLDVVVTASQKGLMNAPGLAFVSVNSKAWRKVEKSALPKFYWNWTRMKEAQALPETPFTPAITLAVAQREALRLIREETLEKIWEKNRRMAEAVRRALTALGMPVFSQAPCDVLTAALVPPGIEGGLLVKRLREEYGISIAGGQEKLKGKIVRIAHMGYIRWEDLEAGFEALEEVLAQMGHRFKRGISLEELKKRELVS